MMSACGAINSLPEERMLGSDNLEILIETKGVRKAVRQLLEEDPEMQFSWCDEGWSIEFSEAFHERQAQLEAKKRELIEQLQQQTFEIWEDRKKLREELCRISRELDRTYQWRQLVTKALNSSGI